MNKDVIISVTGIGTAAAGDTKMELVTEGRYSRKGSTYYVSYDESEVTGMKGTTTTLEVSEGMVTLQRTGTVNSRFVFEKGQRHLTYYDTSYGAFTVGVTARDVCVDIDDSGGMIKVDYSLEIDNNDTDRNNFHMWIREAGKSIDKHG